MFEGLKAKIHAGHAVKPVVAPKIAAKIISDLSGLQAAAPAFVVPSMPAPEPVSTTVESPEPVIAEFEPEPVVAVKLSNEPTIVDYVPEPAAPAPKRTPLIDPAGKLRAYQLEDGTLIAVTRESIEDPLANLNAEDRRPVIPEDEARVDLSQRTSGRITFLTATYESEREDPKYPDRRTKRLANDLARNLHSRPVSIFDPEKTPAAESIKKWIQ